MKEYFKVSEVIDWQHPEIMECAEKIALLYVSAVFLMLHRALNFQKEKTWLLIL
jgi:hypothetical protein